MLVPFSFGLLVDLLRMMKSRTAQLTSCQQLAIEVIATSHSKPKRARMLYKSHPHFFNPLFVTIIHNPSIEIARSGSGSSDPFCIILNSSSQG